MKMLLTGANGFVGNRIKNTYEKDVVVSPSLRNVSEDDVKRIVEESGADAIVHTAAISDIGVCQNNPEQSYIANVMLPVYLAKLAFARTILNNRISPMSCCPSILPRRRRGENWSVLVPTKSIAAAEAMVPIWKKMSARRTSMPNIS